MKLQSLLSYFRLQVVKNVYYYIHISNRTKILFIKFDSQMWEMKNMNNKSQEQ